MTDYKKMYFQLAAKVTDAVEILLKAQQEGESAYMEGEPSSGIKVVAIKNENRDSE